MNEFRKGRLKMEIRLFKVALSTLCFGIFLTLNLTQISVEVRAITFLGGFLSGWGACYSIGRMVGEINTQE